MGDGACESRPGLGSGLNITAVNIYSPEGHRAAVLSSSAAGKGSPPLSVSGALESGR